MKLDNRTINTSKRIAKISLFIDSSKPDAFKARSTPDVWGFRLIDQFGDDLICQQWKNLGFEWITQDVPDGWEVIGFYGDTTQDSLRRLGFILWRPNPLAR